MAKGNHGYKKSDRSTAKMKTDIFQYMDYRQFLRDAFSERKMTSRSFSYRYFADQAGVGSPSYLKAVMDGKRNLTSDTARGFARAFGLNKQEARFFVVLVALNQARTTKDRAHYFEELSRITKFRETKKLEKDQYTYYTRWYCPVIRELAARSDFRDDPQWIADQIRPTITAKQAEEALSLLQALDLLRLGKKGRWIQTKQLVTTGPELRSLTIRSFHREMLFRASTALDEVPLEEREVGGVTIRLTTEQVNMLKQRLKEIQREILQLDGTGDGQEAVYHYAFQLFPVSKLGGN